MAQENIIIKLKDEGKRTDRTAEIRSFIKNRDRRKIQRATLAGKEYTESDLKKLDNGDGEMKITIPRESLVDVIEVQIKCLLVAYDGEKYDPFDALMDSPNEDDYDRIEKAVADVFKKHGDGADREKK